MRVVFGWHLDGPAFPETPGGGAFAVDEAVLGPLGLLGLLETRLGVNGPGTSFALRTAQYLARLRAVDDGDRFFSRSLAADGWATAQRILSWRDDLVADGWSPQAASWQEPRLDAMACVETQEGPPLSPGVPDRVRSVAARLAGDTLANAGLAGAELVDTLTLMAAPESLPLVWRRLIDSLADAGTVIVRAETRPCARRQDLAQDLAKVQAALLGERPAPLEGDGSFSVLRTDDELVAADIVAEWLAAAPDENEGVVLIRQGNSTILDAACRRLGLPQPGGGGDSPFRGAFQALSLVFETVWEPLDAMRLLELIAMPESPVPHRAGRCFADALRDSPGIKGSRWQSAWKEAENRYREDLSKDGVSGPEIEGRVEKARNEWRQWVEPQRFSRNSGIPADVAGETCRRIEGWAHRRAAGANASAPDASGSDASVYVRVRDAAADLAGTIAASGLDAIAKPQLDRMIDAVIADGIGRPGAAGEAAAWTTVDSPARIWDSAPTVLWWGFSGPGAVHPRSPWTGAERAELEAAGATLLSPADASAMEIAAQRRAILNACDRALVVMPAAPAGVASATHPIWHELERLEGLDRATLDGRALRRGESASLCGREWALKAVERHALPGQRRDWSVPGGLIAPRERESASSLESLLGCPMKWVLEYAAGIRGSAPLDMADENRLKGDVAHEVLARFLGGPIPENEVEIGIAVGKLLDELLPGIGSPLLLPGRSGDRDELRRNTVQSAVVLSGILRESGLSVAATEHPGEVRLEDGTTLGGRIDITAATQEGQPVVIDLKWANTDRYRREEIAAARPIQLAAYARLLKDDGDKGPGDPAFAPAAYFMLKQHHLLAVDAGPFPERFRIGGSSLESVWNAILAARQRILGEFAEGRVVATGIPLARDDDADGDPPDGDRPQGGSVAESPEGGPGGSPGASPEESPGVGSPAKEETGARAAGPAENAIDVPPPCRFCSYGRLCGEKFR